MQRITLNDGTVIPAILNASTFETKMEISEETFTNGNLDHFTIRDEEGNVVEYENYMLNTIFEYNGNYGFVLIPIPTEQLAQKELEQTLSDISDAILEMSELVYGGEE